MDKGVCKCVSVDDGVGEGKSVGGGDGVGDSVGEVVGKGVCECVSVGDGVGAGESVGGRACVLHVARLSIEDLNPVQLKIQYRILYSDFLGFYP